MSQHSAVHKTSSTKLARIEVKSRMDKGCVFNNLGHIIDLDLLRECYRSLDGSKAVGIDGVSKEAYGRNDEENLTDLLDRIRKGVYVPRPSRVVEIPKVDGTTRPLAIACVEDKIVQEACKRILERIYEPLFLPESFGFRPGRNPHKALVALNGHLMSGKNGAVVDVDLRRAFDTIPHGHLEEMLRRKISDARFLHLLLKLIRAETVGEDRVPRKSTCGVPQGSILSPLLCNVFLHFVIDEWFREYNSLRLGGRGSLTRYADDLVMTAPDVTAARRLHDELAKRVRSYGMSLHDGKTRVIPNGQIAAKHASVRGTRLPAFTFLGFLHVWGKSRNRRTGKEFWRVKLRTCPKRFRAKLLAIKEHVRRNRHSKDLLARMRAVVQGYLNYFSINDNTDRVSAFVQIVRRILFKWLRRRSQKQVLTWERFAEILKLASFPNPKLLHNLFFTTSAFKTQC
ncbi:MAG: reverse transcriptase domain-containing protein [Burkholderiaceae bacterium]